LEAGLVIISSERNAAQTHVSGFFPRTIAAAEKFGIAHELLDASGIRSRWPQFKVQEDEAAYFEPGGGLVRPELCIGAQLLLATRHGAEVRTDEPVLALSWTGDCVTLETARGSYSADRIILAAGAWLPELLPKYAHLFRVYRQVQVWFEAEDVTAFTRGRFPVFIWELQNSARGLYGFPALDGERAIKVASEEFVAPTAPAETDREISAAELEVVRGLVTSNLRGIRSRCVRATTCLYTVTPDFGFIIGTHPESERVIVASACSGHGFKHSPAIGEALANLALGQPAQLDLQPFRLARFEDVPNRRAPTGPS
jgi:sarcosine oxidase